MKPDVHKIQQMKRDRKDLFEKTQTYMAEIREKKDESAESRNKLDVMLADLEKMTAQIEQDERLLSVADVLEAHKDLQEDQDPEDPKVKYSRAFNDFLRNGLGEMTQENRALLQKNSVDVRAMGVASGAVGGYLVPEDFYNKVVDIMKAYGGMRRAGSTVLVTSGGNDLPIPVGDDTANTGEIVAEGSATGSTSDPSLSQAILKGYLYSSKIIRVGVALLQDEAVGLENLLANWLGVRIGRITNTHFTTGNDTNQPEGILQSCGDSGVTAAAATAIDYLDLISLMHSVDPAYQANGRWMMNDGTLALMKKMQTATEKVPIWMPGVAVREPDTILGKPYVVNQDMPAHTSGLKPIIFGDFSTFFIRDVRGATLMRLVERYADYLQVGFLMFSRHDSAVTVPSAVKYLDVT